MSESFDSNLKRIEFLTVITIFCAMKKLKKNKPFICACGKQYIYIVNYFKHIPECDEYET